jgi:hypothetical protein
MLARTSSAAERETRRALERESAMLAQQAVADDAELRCTAAQIETLREAGGAAVWTGRPPVPLPPHHLAAQRAEVTRLRAEVRPPPLPSPYDEG